jgi:hypothetical protein
MVASRADNKLPEFLVHVGSDNGTAFLQQWFAAHPQLRFVPHALAGLATTLDMSALAGLPPGRFRYLVTSEKNWSNLWMPLLSEADSSGNLPNRAKGYQVYQGTAEQALRAKCVWLKHFFSTARILYLTCGFETQLRSYYLLMARSGFRHRPTDIMGFLKASPEVLGAANFDLVLRVYGEYFGGENLCVLPYELLRDSPNQFLRELERALGLEYFSFAAEHTDSFVSDENAALDIEPRFLEQFRGYARSLQTNPLYAPYAQAYLF